MKIERRLRDQESEDIKKEQNSLNKVNRELEELKAKWEKAEKLRKKAIIEFNSV